MFDKIIIECILVIINEINLMRTKYFVINPLLTTGNISVIVRVFNVSKHLVHIMTELLIVIITMPEKVALIHMASEVGLIMVHAVGFVSVVNDDQFLI